MGIFNTTITGKRAATSSDARGMTSRNWAGATTICTAVPASVQKMSAHRIQDFALRQLDCDFDIFTRTNSTLRKGDRAIDDTSGATFEVVDNDDMAGRGKMFCLACKKTV